MTSAALARPYCMDAEATRPVLVTAEVGGLPPDLVTVDWLARLELLAHRQGGRIAVHGASTELRELIHLAGLDRLLFGDSPGRPRLPPPPGPARRAQA